MARDPEAPGAGHPRPAEADHRPRWPTRLGWLALIWALSVAVLGLVAWLIRVFMRAAGMTT